MVGLFGLNVARLHNTSRPTPDESVAASRELHDSEFSYEADHGNGFKVKINPPRTSTPPPPPPTPAPPNSSQHKWSYSNKRRGIRKDYWGWREDYRAGGVGE